MKGISKMIFPKIITMPIISSPKKSAEFPSKRPRTYQSFIKNIPIRKGKINNNGAKRISVLINFVLLF